LCNYLNKTLNQVKKTIYLLCLFLASCGFEDINFDNIEVEEWQPTFALPIFQGNITISDMVSATDSSFLRAREDGLLEFVYSQSVLSFDLDNLVEVPAITPDRNTFEAPFPGTTPIDIIATETIPVDLGLSEAELYTIDLKSGDVNFTFNSTFDFDFDVLLTIPTAKLNGTPFSQNITIPANSTNLEQKISLANYILDFEDGSSNSTPNKFPIQFRVTIKANSTFQAGDKLDVDSSIDNIQHKVVYCNLMQRAVSLPADTLEITAYDNTFDIGDLKLDSPSLSFEIINRYGIPFNFDFSNNTPLAVETKTNISVKAQIPELPVSIGGFSDKNDFNIINFPDIFNLRPDEIRYESVGQVNPDTPATKSNPNILTDTSNVEGIATVVLPFIGSGSVQFFGDTTDVDLSLDDDIDAFLSATIRIVINTSIPLDADIQFYFMDDNFNVIDSVLSAENTFFSGAEVNSDGRPINDSEIIVEEVLNAQELERILKTTKMTLVGTFSTSGNGSVRIHDTDNFKIQVGLLTNVKISISE
jgi:hypothetical protein